MLKGLILIIGFIIGFILAIICLSISYGYNDEYQRNKRWPYYKEEPDKDIKSIIWLGIGTIILFLTKLLMEHVG